MTTNRRVLVLACDVDGETTHDICRLLEGKGLDCILADDQADDWLAVVVVLSSAAAASAALVQAVSSNKSGRLVPVCASPVSDDRLPEFLTELNWVLWYGLSEAEREAAVLHGVLTDLGRYRESKAVEHEARSWAASGRNADYLIADFARVKALRRRLSAQSAAPSSPPTPLAREFISHSWASCRKARRWRSARWFFRASTSVVIIALGVLFLWPMLQFTSGSSELARVMLVEEYREELDALRLAAVSIFLVAHDEPVRIPIEQRMIRDLSAPWTTGEIIPGDQFVNAAVLWHSDAVLTADMAGRIGRFDLASGEWSWATQVSESPLTDLGVDQATGAMIAADSDGRVFVTDDQGFIDWTSNAPTDVLTVRIGGDVVLVVGTDGRVFTSSTAAPQWTARPTENVLDARVSEDGDVRVLSRRGATLLISDVDGQTLRTHALPEYGFDVASLDPTGQNVVAVGPGPQLWTALDGSDLRASGHVVPDLLRSLEISTSGLVAYAADPSGAQLYDPRRAMAIGDVCMGALGRFSSVVTDSESMRVLCFTDVAPHVEDISARVPHDGPAQDVALSKARSASVVVRDRTSSVEILADHRVRFTSGVHVIELDPRGEWFAPQPNGAVDFGESASYDPGSLRFRGLPTVVALDEGGMTAAIGSSNGTVSEVDFGNGVAYLASVWEAPGGEAIGSLGWNRAHGTLVVGTAQGHWYEPPSCASCGGNTFVLWAAVRDRSWNCYLGGTVDIFDADTAETLGVEECPARLGTRSQP